METMGTGVHCGILLSPGLSSNLGQRGRVMEAMGTGVPYDIPWVIACSGDGHLRAAVTSRLAATFHHFSSGRGICAGRLIINIGVWVYNAARCSVMDHQSLM